MTPDKSRADALTPERRFHFANRMIHIDDLEDRIALVRTIEREALAAAPVSQPAAAPPMKLLGETRESGVVWFDRNPHAFPIGTKFYAASNEQPAAAPIDMLLFCPKCGKQHVDEPEVVFGDADDSDSEVTWENPPHRSHLCHACGTIWRPADVPTNGVAAIQTRGKADTWLRTARASSANETGAEGATVAWMRADDPRDCISDAKKRDMIELAGTPGARLAENYSIALGVIAPAHAAEPAAIPKRVSGVWPTNDMNRAGLKALAEFHHSRGDTVDAVFLAMSAAAPQPPAQADARVGLTDKALRELYNMAYQECYFDEFRARAVALLAAHPGQPEPRAEVTDTARLDWLCEHVVNVRHPLLYGLRDMFWASPTDDDSSHAPSDLRAQIDAARAGEKQ
ncbi:hypothetical protein KDX01_07225 [Burkholderia vietnamiensis]|uniref:hypothetical protein n=1 Tax=Burkholderia vietnamiensis TaxID=60552 RepID=UPI001B9E8DB3|nr:hypothetical protein [Burkholderia vietnamiensis]MBR7972907.1 hypothetical protein [Burkholderia vietnamiensis]